MATALKGDAFWATVETCEMAIEPGALDDLWEVALNDEDDTLMKALLVAYYLYTEEVWVRLDANGNDVYESLPAENNQKAAKLVERAYKLVADHVIRGEAAKQKALEQWEDALNAVERERAAQREQVLQKLSFEERQLLMAHWRMMMGADDATPE